MITPSHVSLPNTTPLALPANVNVISNVSDPSTSSSQVTAILALPSVSPALIVILNGSELKSTPDPVKQQNENFYCIAAYS